MVAKITDTFAERLYQMFREIIYLEVCFQFQPHHMDGFLNMDKYGLENSFSLLTFYFLCTRYQDRLFHFSPLASAKAMPILASRLKPTELRWRVRIHDQDKKSFNSTTSEKWLRSIQV
jgi:hypothetical protein